MKTTQKKIPVLEFSEVFIDGTDAQTYEVSQGTQRLGHVTYEIWGDLCFVTDLYVLPEFTAFGVETQILDALLAFDHVQSVTVVAPLSAVSYYEGAGFVCDPTQVLLTKRKA